MRRPFAVLAFCCLSYAAQASGELLLTLPEPAMVRLPRAELTLGSTPQELVSAAEHCNREAHDEVCTPETFATELSGPKLLIEGFWLDRYEVSYGDYERCVRAGKCRASVYEGAERLERPELPVVFVSYRDATDYCSFRRARLPTEAELERAARGTTRRNFPWGNAWNGQVSNHGRLGAVPTDPSDGFDELAPVTSFAGGRTAEGIQNLAGNVAEWTNTPYALYTEPGSPSGELVVRGGHYMQASAWLRSAARSHAAPSERTAFLGFRCARSDEPARDDEPPS